MLSRFVGSFDQRFSGKDFSLYVAKQSRLFTNHDQHDASYDKQVEKRSQKQCGCFHLCCHLTDVLRPLQDRDALLSRLTAHDHRRIHRVLGRPHPVAQQGTDQDFAWRSQPDRTSQKARNRCLTRPSFLPYPPPAQMLGHVDVRGPLMGSQPFSFFAERRKGASVACPT